MFPGGTNARGRPRSRCLLTAPSLARRLPATNGGLRLQRGGAAQPGSERGTWPQAAPASACGRLGARWDTRRSLARCSRRHRRPLATREATGESRLQAPGPLLDERWGSFRLRPPLSLPTTPPPLPLMDAASCQPPPTQGARANKRPVGCAEWRPFVVYGNQSLFAELHRHSWPSASPRFRVCASINSDIAAQKPEQDLAAAAAAAAAAAVGLGIGCCPVCGHHRRGLWASTIHRQRESSFWLASSTRGARAKLRRPVAQLGEGC
ncbi:unnamed protein product [Lampetra planeri]